MTKSFPVPDEITIGKFWDAIRAHNFDAVREHLLTYGTNIVNVRDLTGWTPLMRVVNFDRAGFTMRNLAILLLDHGAGVKDTTPAVVNPILLLTENAEMMRVLLRYGANPEERSRGGASPLEWAVVNGKLGVAEVLLQNRARVNVANNEGYTPLMYAARWDNVQMIDVLMKYGANHTLKNRQGLTAQEMALDERSRNALQRWAGIKAERKRRAEEEREQEFVRPLIESVHQAKRRVVLKRKGPGGRKP